MVPSVSFAAIFSPAPLLHEGAWAVKPNPWLPLALFPSLSWQGLGGGVAGLAFRSAQEYWTSCEQVTSCSEASREGT